MTSKTNKLQWWIKLCVTGWCFYNFGGINSLLDGNYKKGNLWTKVENNLLSIVYTLTPFSFKDLNLLLLPLSSDFLSHNNYYNYLKLN